ncbi:unnamed protein product [Mytilus edulis]|uniref:Uncharacterized protein n=2 Tax=Mytilus TaxID=6548 RepID=A0A8B6H2P6_MYTGA|nr:unnamed protein product [Mytilus edulis]VDI73558.1 Hypothetical predicted protein [Mytilus galloprovincialis]
MADNDSEDDERGILCAHYDTSRMPACGKSGAKFCSLVYIILNILTCSLIVHLVGFSTAYWSHGEDFYHTGLWLLCGINKHRCQYLPYHAAWFEATQALETLGLFAAFLALVFLVLFIFHPQSTSNKAIFIIGMVSTFVAAGFTVLGIVIYGAKNRDLSWSYGLTVIAGAMYTGSGILMVLHLNLNLQQT